MAWKDPRGSARTVVVVAREVAHRDDSKARHHDASQLARRGFPRKLIAGSVLGAVVLVAVIVALTRGGEDPTEPAVAQVAGQASASPVVATSASASPTPEDLLAASAPDGKWNLRQSYRFGVQNNGARTQSGAYKPENLTWTFPEPSCTDSACTGKISSSSGRTFPFTWDGTTLVVKRHGVSKTPKQACYDTVTGEIMPIEQSAAIITYHTSYTPFVGSPDRLHSQVESRVTYQFFGDCELQPDTVVRVVEDQVITPKS